VTAYAALGAGRVLSKTAFGDAPAFVAVDPLRRVWVTRAGAAPR
jgi:hypothetical protein